MHLRRMCIHMLLDRLFFFKNLFIFLLHWVYIAVHRLPLVAENRGYSSLQYVASHCGGFSCCEAPDVGAQASVALVFGVSSCGSRALESRLSSCGTRAQLL